MVLSSSPRWCNRAGDASGRKTGCLIIYGNYPAPLNCRIIADMKTTSPTAAESVTVQIHGLAVGGAAVGRVTGPENSARVGMTAFVPFAAPGETVTATITRAYARYLETELSEILTPSPDRVTPPCPYFGTCGGCDIQHLAYPAQCATKREMVRGAFRAGGQPDIAEKIGDVVSGPPLSYRRRITLHINAAGDIGYYQRHSHSVLPVISCPIAAPEIEQFLARKVSFSGNVPASLQGELHIEIAENGLFAVLKSVGHLSEREANRLLEQLRPHIQGGLVEADGRIIAQFGQTAMLRKMAGLTHTEADGELAPGVFSQVNATINEALVDRVLSIAKDTDAQTACDLYAGAGNFAIPLAAQGLTVTAVELVAALVTSGRAEVARRGLKDKVTFHKTDVSRYLQQQPQPADLIVADPPRSGLGKLVSQLAFAPNLILISCDLPSAVRDIKGLQAAGWSVETVTPYDMFAQTAHIELLTYLHR